MPLPLLFCKKCNGWWKISSKFPKSAFSKSYNTNTLKRGIFTFILQSVPLSTFLSTHFAGTGPKEQKLRGGAVYLLHLLFSPHWAHPQSSHPCPTIPTSCPAKLYHHFGVCGGTSLPVQKLYYLDCHSQHLCIDNLFYTGTSKQLTFSCQSLASPLYVISSYGFIKISTSNVNEGFVEGTTEITAALFDYLPTKQRVCSIIHTPIPLPLILFFPKVGLKEDKLQSKNIALCAVAGTAVL